MLGGKRITIIAAMALNRAIGRDGGLPWHLPRELRHFKEATMGKPIVMGRRTWQSIGRPLPGRQNIVVTRNPAFRAEGCDVAASLDGAVALARGEEIMVIGGADLYGASLGYADRMLLTLVECEPDADAWFPEWRKEDWLEKPVRSEPADERNPFAYRVLELTRKPGEPATTHG